MNIHLEDRLFVYELLALYGHLVDDRAFGRFDEIFTSDAVFDLRPYGGLCHRGLDAIQTMMRTSTEHPLAHHPCFEEAYCLDGTFDYNFGEMVKGQYFFRPRGIRHGDFSAGEEGTVWLLRCDGQLVDWYTDNASVELKGDPVNWGDGYPNTEPPEFVLPVRSKSVGPMKRPDYM